MQHSFWVVVPDLHDLVTRTDRNSNFCVTRGIAGQRNHLAPPGQSFSQKLLETALIYSETYKEDSVVLLLEDLVARRLYTPPRCQSIGIPAGRRGVLPT